VFARLRQEVDRNPAGPIDHSALLFADGDGEEPYIAGLADLTAEWTESGEEWTTVVDIVHAINDGAITRWEVVEENLRTVDLYSNRLRVLAELAQEDLTPRVAALHWDVARSSDDLRAIKWGLTIGAILLTREELDDLMIFARHSEFTSIACEAIVRESERRPEYRTALLELLTTTTGLGRVIALGAVLSERDLIVDSATRWRVASSAAELRAALMPSFAVQIVEQLDLAALAVEGELTEKRFVELCTIAEALLGVDDPKEVWRNIGVAAYIEALVDLARREYRSPAGMSMLRSLRVALGDEAHAGLVHDDLRGAIDEAYRQMLDPDVLRRGIADRHYRDVSLVVIIEEGLESLVPDVRSEFEREPSALSVVALGTLGGEEELTLLYRWIADGLDRAARSELLTGRSIADSGEDHPSSAYAVVLQFLGRLRTPEAIELIREGLTDFDPVVRRAAMIAVTELEEWQLDDDLKRRVGIASGDAFEFVRTAANAAIEQHGLHRYRGESEAPGMN
jgi:hypothetical protein